MQKTKIYEFYKPEQLDDVLDTITKLSQNFEKIDGLIDESTDNLISFLVKGKTYEIGKRVWNTLPTVGGNAGWINIRSGVYAPTWQKKTIYKLGDIVMSNGNNGHYYQCTESGESGLSSPSFPTTVGQSVFDHAGATAWNANYVYELDDLVLAPLGDQLYYYKCIKKGTSSTIEPTWSRVSGMTFMDGTVQWQTYKTVKWTEVGVSCEFREFGKIV